MLQRPAALLSDVGSRLWSIAGSDNSNNADDIINNSEASNSTGNTHADHSKSIRQRLSQSTLIERLSNSRAHHNNNNSSTPSTASHHRDLLHHHGGELNEHIQDITIAPTSHRENTAFHALRDTFVFPSPASLLPALPTIPCMSGLGQSNLFADHGPLSSERKNNPNLKGAAYDPQHHRYADQHRRGISMEDEQNDIHHQKVGALFLGSNSKHDSFKKLNNGLNVLMLGGYRGSILRDAASGRRLWVPLKVGFNVRKAELAIDLDDEAEMRSGGWLHVHDQKKPRD